MNTLKGTWQIWKARCWTVIIRMRIPQYARICWQFAFYMQMHIVLSTVHKFSYNLHQFGSNIRTLNYLIYKLNTYLIMWYYIIIYFTYCSLYTYIYILINVDRIFLRFSKHTIFLYVSDVSLIKNIYCFLCVRACSWHGSHGSHTCNNVCSMDGHTRYHTDYLDAKGYRYIRPWMPGGI